MHSFIYDSYTSAIGNASDSITLRCAILISDELTFAGNRYGVIDFEKWFDMKTMEKKVRAIHSLQKSNGIMPADDLDEMIKSIHRFNNKKGKSNQEVVAFKLWEKTTSEFYEELKQKEVTRLQTEGLINLKPLLSENYFHVLYNEDAKPEIYDAAKYLTPVSQMLTLEKRYQEELEEFNPSLQTVFLLQDEFHGELSKPGKSEKGEIKSFSQTLFYRHKLLTFPNLNYASANEIAALRNFIQPLIKEFNRQMDQWLKLVDDENREAESFLVSTVIPSCMKLQKQIDNNENMKALYLLSERSTNIEIYAGEILLPDIWNFYEHFYALKEESMAALDKKKNENKLYSKKYPVLCIYGSKRGSPHWLSEEINDVKAVKKNLSIE